MASSAAFTSSWAISPQQPFADDDKYAKKRDSLLESSSKCCADFGPLSLRSLLTSKGVAALLRNPFQLYTTFLMLVLLCHHRLGGSFADTRVDILLSFASTIAEGFGLISLREKIKRQGSVAGISGGTMGMYALVYLLREVLLMPPLGWQNLDGWTVEVLQLASLVMVFDVLRSVLVTYRKTYQVDLDVLGMKHLVPACLLLVVLLRPSFREGPWFSVCWTFYFYLDILSLLPQVVMMARGAGKVEAPIAHFVAATAMSRAVDLWFWFFEFEAVSHQLNFYLPGEINYSGWLIVMLHIFSLVLVGDFMYYYTKARLSGSAFSEDLSLPTLDVDIC